MRLSGCPILIAVALCSSMCAAQNTIPKPQLLSIFPPGGKAGASLELELTEEVDLAVATGLRFSHPGITAEPIKLEADRFNPDPKPLRDRFKVTIAANVPAGVYEVRAACRYGVSNARRFVVSNDQELIEEEPNNDPDNANDLQIGSTVNGTFGSDFDYYRLEAKQGQKLVIDCFAQRIDSGGDPVLSLLDENKKTIQRAQDTVGNDATLVYICERDQTLLVRVNDLTYMAGGGAQKAAYRLTVREGPWIDFVNPPLAVRGKSNRLTIYGRNLNGTAVDASLFGAASFNGDLEKVEIDFTPPADAGSNKDAINSLVIQPFQPTESIYALRHTVAGKPSNAFPVTLIDDPMSDEVEPNDSLESAQSLTGDASILARFDMNGDVDHYHFTAKKDERFHIQIDSHQILASNDPLLVVQSLAKQQDGSIKPRDLKVIDDENQDNNTFRFDWSTYDPGFEFVAPQDGEYNILVQNQYGSENGFPNYYRLTFCRAAAGFRLLACAGMMIGQNNNRNLPVTPASCVVRRGGAGEILLVARRSGGFDGEIEIQAEQLPPGVTAEPVAIGPGETFATLVLKGAADAKAWSGPIRVTGKALNPDAANEEITRVAHAVEIVRPILNNNNQTQAPSRIGQEIFVTVDEGTPISGRIETPDLHLRMARGGRLQLPLKFLKQSEFSGNISAFACGLPQLISRSNTNLSADGKEAKMNLDVQQSCLPGKYSFFVRADLDTDFRRYPELSDEAKADQTRLNTMFNDMNKAYQLATQQRGRSEQNQRNAVSKKTSADNLLKQRQREMAVIEPQLKQAQQQYQKATEKLNQAIQNLEAANKQLAAAGDEAAKKTAQQNVATMQQAMQTAEASMKTVKTKLDPMTVQLANAQKQLVDAEQQMKTANEALEKANSEVEKARTDEATAKSDRDTAQQKKTQADQWVQRTNQITQQRKVKTYAHSPSLMIEVVPFPIALKLEKEKYEIVAGEKLDLNVLAARDFEAKEEIRFQILPPPGVGGWSLGKKQKIEKDADKGVIELNIASSVMAGEYTARLRGTYRFNNRNISQEIEIPVSVKPSPKK